MALMGCKELSGSLAGVIMSLWWCINISRPRNSIFRTLHFWCGKFSIK